MSDDPFEFLDKEFCFIRIDFDSARNLTVNVEGVPDWLVRHCLEEAISIWESEDEVMFTPEEDE